LISLIAAGFKMQRIERHSFWAMLQDLRWRNDHYS